MFSAKIEAGSASAVFYGHDYREELPIEKRPVIVVVPGGGYEHVSVREGDIIAMQFMAMGYHAAVLTYSVNKDSYFPTQLCELAVLVAAIRENAAEWHVDVDKIVPCGFSAGAHLVGCLSSFWQEKWLCDIVKVKPEQIKPNAQILCYPVITSGKYAHEGSFRALLGKDYDEKKDFLSLEKCVNSGVPKSFIWHTFPDGAVPVQNSLMYASALADAGISVEYHLFEQGGHGCSLGTWITTNDEKQLQPTLTPWIDLAHTWLENL